MHYANGGIGSVNRLTAGAAGTKDVDAQILVVDLDVDLLGLRHDGNRRRRGMDSAARFGDRHALHPMHAGFEFETGEGVAAVDRCDRLFVTANTDFIDV